MQSLVDIKKLKKYIEDNNISEVELSKIIGVDYTMVYRVLRGTRNPGPKFITGLLDWNIEASYKKIIMPKLLPCGNK